MFEPIQACGEDPSKILIQETDLARTHSYVASINLSIAGVIVVVIIIIIILVVVIITIIIIIITNHSYKPPGKVMPGGQGIESSHFTVKTLWAKFQIDQGILFESSKHTTHGTTTATQGEEPMGKVLGLLTSIFTRS